MAGATSQICRGVMTDALRAALGPVVKWSAQEACVEDVSKCAVPGSPTIVKCAFAPSPRAEKAGLVEAAKQPMEVLMKPILKGQPKLETDLVAQPRRF